MIDTRGILGAATMMQQNAQASLPVIPNNGNPAGAYNMPQQAQPVVKQEAKSPYYYPWLAPSDRMESIRATLDQRQNSFASLFFNMLRPQQQQQQPENHLQQPPPPTAAPVPQVNPRLNPDRWAEYTAHAAPGFGGNPVMPEIGRTRWENFGVPR